MDDSRHYSSKRDLDADFNYFLGLLGEEIDSPEEGGRDPILS